MSRIKREKVIERCSICSNWTVLFCRKNRHVHGALSISRTFTVIGERQRSHHVTVRLGGPPQASEVPGHDVSAWCLRCSSVGRAVAGAT